MNRRKFLRGISISSLPIFGGCSQLSNQQRRSPIESTSENNSQTIPMHALYEKIAISVRSGTGEELGNLTASIADTEELRYEGLSSTSSLPDDRGMLFVYQEPQAHAFVMRGMDFGIDIIFINAEQTITRIHHAEKPGPNENGENQVYTGWGQYVLEVSLNWTAKRSISENDTVDFTL